MQLMLKGSSPFFDNIVILRDGVIWLTHQAHNLVMQVQVLLPQFLKFIMIQIQTKLNVRDNTGIKSARCIKVYRGLSAKIGDIILISVTLLKKKVASKIKITKGNLFKALVIRTVYNHKQASGVYVKFQENSVVLLNNKDTVMGTRISGPIPRVLRKLKHLKVISLSSNII